MSGVPTPRADRISKCQHSYVKLLCQITSKNSKKHGSSSRPFGGSLLFLLFGELAAGSSSLIHFLCLCKESDKESTADFDAETAFS